MDNVMGKMSVYVTPPLVTIQYVKKKNMSNIKTETKNIL